MMSSSSRPLENIKANNLNQVKSNTFQSTETHTSFRGFTATSDIILNVHIYSLMAAAEDRHHAPPTNSYKLIIFSGSNGGI